jgi:hypothetical protein
MDVSAFPHTAMQGVPEGVRIDGLRHVRPPREADQGRAHGLLVDVDLEVDRRREQPGGGVAVRRVRVEPLLQERPPRALNLRADASLALDLRLLELNLERGAVHGVDVAQLERQGLADPAARRGENRDQRAVPLVRACLEEGVHVGGHERLVEAGQFLLPSPLPRHLVEEIVALVRLVEHPQNGPVAGRRLQECEVERLELLDRQLQERPGRLRAHRPQELGVLLQRLATRPAPHAVVRELCEPGLGPSGHASGRPLVDPRLLHVLLSGHPITGPDMGLGVDEVISP